MVGRKAHEKMSFPVRVFGTVVCIMFYRLLSNIPLPFVDTSMLDMMYDMSGSMGMLNLLTGGNLSRMSIASLGISPYISSSIIIQLFSIMIPPLAALQRDGAVGRKRIKQLTMVLSGVFAGISGAALVYSYWTSGLMLIDSWEQGLIPWVCMVAAALIFTQMGQYIDDALFGNGISLFLLAGILCSVPSGLMSTVENLMSMENGAILTGLFIGAVVLLFGFLYFVHRCERVYPVSYSQKAPDERTRDVSVLSLKLLASSVMPVIFASTILALPSAVSMFLGRDIAWLSIFDTSSWFDSSEPWTSIGIPIYLFLIFMFTSYSQSMSVNETEIADQMRRNGCVIEGVAPGEPTEAFLHKEMSALNKLGALVLSVVAFVPIAAFQLLDVSTGGLLGTSMILIVSIMYDTWYAFRVEAVSYSYSRYMRRMKPRAKLKDGFCLLNRKVRN